MGASDSVDVGTFDVSLAQVALPMGLVLSRVRIWGQDLHLEREPFVIQVSQPGRMEITVSEDQLAAFLEREAPGGLRNFRVTADGGKLTVQATARILVEITAEAVCTLRADDGTRLFVELESLSVPAARNLVQNQLERVNPIVDLDDLPIGGRIQQIEISGGQVVLRGQVTPRASYP